jgi:1-deoxy-D-xylulose-5-phosphate synthase
MASEILMSVHSPIEMGKSETIYEGEEVALVSYGNMADEVMIAYEKLISSGYNPKFINARFASPVDEDMLTELKEKFKYIFTFEDNIHSGGFGSVVSQRLAEMGIDGKVIHNFSFPDTYVEHGNRAELLKRYRLDGESMGEDILKILEKK